MKLINGVGNTVRLGDLVLAISGDGEPKLFAIILDIYEPDALDNSGKVRVAWVPARPGHETLYYVSVFGLLFVED